MEQTLVSLTLAIVLTQELEQAKGVQDSKKQENLTKMTENDHSQHSNSSTIQAPARITANTDNIESNIAEIHNGEKKWQKQYDPL